jgi:hypothetical protein
VRTWVAAARTSSPAHQTALHRYLATGLAGSITAILFVGTARAATVSVQLIDVEPTLTYVADPGEANDVTIRYGPSFVTEIVDEGATITVGPGCSSIAPDTARCSGSLAIDADLGDGNDHLVVDSDFDVETGIFRGGEGNDKISASGGPFSFARLFGGPGMMSLRATTAPT